MIFVCLPEFKEAFEKLVKNKSYASLEGSLCDYFSGAEVQDVLSGVNLNQNHDLPLIKKRLEGAGGFRLYYYVIIKDGKLYFLHVHPKTGSKGYESLSKGEIQGLRNQFAALRNSKQWLAVEFDAVNRKVIFK